MSKKFSLSEEELKSFYENGFVGPFSLYEPEEMTEIWKKVRMDILDTGDAVFQDSRLNYDRHLDMAQLNRVISHPKIAERVSSILGPDVLSWRTEWFPKYPGDEGTDWHQAEAFVEFEGTEKLRPTAKKEGQPWELTAWVAMTEATKENGCMKVVPKTYKKWFFDEKKNISFEPEQVNQVRSDGRKSGFYGYDYDKLKLEDGWVPNEADAIHMELKPGQFFLFTSRCLHGSNGNTSKNSTRVGWATRFVPTHVRVYEGQDSFKHYGEEFSLSRYSTVLVQGKDSFGHNRVRLPMRQTRV